MDNLTYKKIFRFNALEWLFLFFMFAVALTNLTLFTKGLSPFSLEEYHLVENVEKNLFAYMKSHMVGTAYSPLATIHYWISRRLLGGQSIGDYKILTYIFTMGSLLSIYLVLRKIRLEQLNLIAGIIFFILGFNYSIQFFAQWSIDSYILFLFFSVWIIYFVYKTPYNDLSKTEKILFIVFSILAPYNHIGIIIGYASAVTAILLIYYYEGNQRNHRIIIPFLRKITPFAVLPLITAICYLTYPGIKSNSAKPWYFMFYFPTSGYDHDFMGLLKFFFESTNTLLKSIINTTNLHLYHLLLFCFAVGFTKSFFMKDRFRKYLSIYLVLSLFLLLILSIMKLYPFSNIRHGIFFIFPVVAITAVGILDLLNLSNLIHVRFGRILMSFLILVISLISINETISNYKRSHNMKLTAEKAEAMLSEEHDLIFHYQWFNAIFNIFLPKVGPEKIVNIGYPTDHILYNGYKDNGLHNFLSKVENGDAINQILTITSNASCYDSKCYPICRKILENGFKRYEQAVIYPPYQETIYFEIWRKQVKNPSKGGQWSVH